MPNKDGTGPLGQGPGTGRTRGGCGAGRGNNANNASQGQGRRKAGGNLAGSSGRAHGLGKNNTDNTQNK